MAFTVFTYKDNTIEAQESFSTIKEAFKHLGNLDLATNVERCILDDGEKILFDLKRNENGWLSS